MRSLPVRGVTTTLRALDRSGIRHAGTARSPRERRRTPILRVKGLRIAFLAYTALTNGQRVPNPWSLELADAARVLADARRARRRGADSVIVNLHWGDEYRHTITPSQAVLARRLTRSPAIAPSSASTPTWCSRYAAFAGKPVVFGEGNLVSNQTAACCPAASQDGLIALIDFVARGGRVRVRRVRYVPTWVRHPDYRVLPARPGSTSWRRTVAVVGRRPAIRPIAQRP